MAASSSSSSSSSSSGERKSSIALAAAVGLAVGVGLVAGLSALSARRNKAKLRTLYPEIKNYNEGRLKVSDIHELYWEESGNPAGKPVVVLHGGPGGGVAPSMRQYFDPKVWRIIMFDQRGAGKSTPSASLVDNTTSDLVSDIEKLRVLLKIDRWVVWGGSWGATLAIAYAEAHRERVKALVLRGVFLVRRKELTWFYQEGASMMFPDLHAKFRDHIPDGERHDLISAYHRRLTSTDAKVQLEAAQIWSTWEMCTSRLVLDPTLEARAMKETGWALQFARIEAHYFANGGFFSSEDQLLKNAHILKGIPGTIVQGRYDVVCPMQSAYDLHRIWSDARFRVVNLAGHSAREDGIISELVSAMDLYKDL